MAKRIVQRPLDDDPADVVRRVVAKWEFKDLLAEDLRVREVWRQWCDTPAAQRYYSALEVAGDNADRIDQAHAREQPRLSTAFGAAIPMLVSTRWIGDWLADMHLLLFRAVVNKSLLKVKMQLGRPFATRSRRQPKNDGAIIKRDVRWFYQARIKEPPDSVSKLARQYASGSQRSSARSVVQDGIRRASVLLEIAAPPLP